MEFFSTLIEHWGIGAIGQQQCGNDALLLGLDGGEGLIPAGAAGAVAAGATATTAAGRAHGAVGSFGQGGEGGEHAPA